MQGDLSDWISKWTVVSYCFAEVRRCSNLYIFKQENVQWKNRFPWIAGLDSNMSKSLIRRSLRFLQRQHVLNNQFRLHEDFWLVQNSHHDGTTWFSKCRPCPANSSKRGCSPELDCTSQPLASHDHSGSEEQKRNWWIQQVCQHFCRRCPSLLTSLWKLL